MIEEKNKFAWDTLDTMTLIQPNEIITYHLYRYGLNKTSRTKLAEEDLKALKSYLNEYEKGSSEKECSKK